MMKMTRQPLIFAVSLAALLALSACGKKDDSATPEGGAMAPAAEPAATPPAPAAAAAVTFGSVEVGSSIDAGNKILASGTSFAPKDTIYASVDTSGSGSGTLAAKWTFQDGQTVHEDSKSLAATGPESTAFMISKPSGLPVGSYKVEISLNGAPVASKDFSVK